MSTYLKANIEGGEKFNWFYNDSNNLGIGLDPNGTNLRVSLPEGDRLAQSRNQYYPNQQLLANKQLRWWWNNYHYAVYDDGDGTGWSPHGSPTEWVPNSKSITFAEYGFPACDKCTNQPNLFYSPASTESGTPFWSIWDPSAIASGDYWPRRDDELYLLALQAVYEYWVSDGNNETVGGVPMIQTTFMSVWNWDARPFPTFPNMVSVWGDTGDWPAGNWLGGKGPFLTPLVPSTPPTPGPYSTFPSIDTIGWSVKFSPIFSTGTAMHVSGKELRAAKYVVPLWSIELNYDVLRLRDRRRDVVLSCQAGIDAALAAGDVDLLIAPMAAAAKCTGKAGAPVAAIPAGLNSQGTPFGVTLYASPGSDWRLLNMAAAVEAIIGKRHVPKL